MSYIRSGSNPEGLYIIGNMNDQLEIFDDPDERSKTMPIEVFEKLCKMWFDNFCDDVEYKGASIEDVCVFKDDGELSPIETRCTDMKERPIAFKTRLSYTGKTAADDWFVDMYDVTWFYIAHRAIQKPPSRIKSFFTWHFYHRWTS